MKILEAPLNDANVDIFLIKLEKRVAKNKLSSYSLSYLIT